MNSWIDGFTGRSCDREAKFKLGPRFGVRLIPTPQTMRESRLARPLRAAEMIRRRDQKASLSLTLHLCSSTRIGSPNTLVRSMHRSNMWRRQLSCLKKTVKGDAEAAPLMETDWDERLLIHVSYSPRRKHCSLSFPRRVFIPWLAGSYIGDYLQPSETLEGLKDHCVELMSVDTTTDYSTILQPEIEPPTLSAKFFWGVSVPFSLTSSPDCSSLKKSGIVTS